jgi:flagellar motor switch protein FliN/FliY
MMGGDGSNTDGELTDLHLSAIGEAMNQMIGSAATSMSSIFEKKVDISPPKAFCISIEENAEEVFEPQDKLVKVAFKMVIGDLVDSEIMQLIPLDIAKIIVENLMSANAESKPPLQDNNVSTQPSMPEAQDYPQQQQQQNYPQQPQPQQPQPQQPQYYPQPQYQDQQYHQQQNMGQPYYGQQPQGRFSDPVNVQTAQFQAFDDGVAAFSKKNIGLIMDVPLQVTVELGRTNKMIRDILEFGPGSIIELDKLAGEPVDILVNGKVIAKGEVVVIDESFGVRITDIIHPSKRL